VERDKVVSCLCEDKGCVTMTTLSSRNTKTLKKDNEMID